MASKRANAIKAAQKQEEIADRMSAIERNQALIMAALGIRDIPGVEAETLEEPELSPEDEGDEPPALHEQGSIVDYAAMKVPDLVEEAMKRGIYDGIEGSGKDGNVVRDDLVAALVAYDEAASK